MSKPRIEHGYDFNGRSIGRVTFDLNDPDCDAQMAQFFDEHPNITVESDLDEEETQK